MNRLKFGRLAKKNVCHSRDRKSRGNKFSHNVPLNREGNLTFRSAIEIVLFTSLQSCPSLSEDFKRL